MSLNIFQYVFVFCDVPAVFFLSKQKKGVRKRFVAFDVDDPLITSTISLHAEVGKNSVPVT